MFTFEVIVGALFVLATGSYGYTWMAMSRMEDRMNGRIDKLYENDLKHIEDRMSVLEHSGRF